MRTADFDYHLPEELIAQTAAEPRDSSRLLILHADGAREHRIFRDLPDYLRPGDALVLNDTRVIMARLQGRLAPGGGAVEALLLRELGDGRWETMVRPGRRLRPGRAVDFGGLRASVAEARGEGFAVLAFPAGSDPTLHGALPLPHYIHELPDDPERYQTVYAREPGSAAAPTAGLHFTPELLAAIRAKGVAIHTITLHVGPGTFRPVSADDPAQHPMHEEWFTISEETAAALNAVRASGGRLVATGTTVVRTLEQVASDTPDGTLRGASGWTRLLILPGYRFKAVDALITNFHLPRSTLLMLVSAFAGRERILDAYAEAVRRRYRFYSFGDAMLLLR
ncbi:MAG TPA: tRNA preQ1(34) S-adenosylmethionine ribosyltransferase-isomerase QueA [Dehalococcoidia bacterium]|nr:tRNA preQ1(34) S-adenosylmethionine ribosyltransferase-isomerase QueA [Dehalococcoidia bacterium]